MFILPLTAAMAAGDIVRVTGIGSGGWHIFHNAGQSTIVKNLSRSGDRQTCAAELASA